MYNKFKQILGRIKKAPIALLVVGFSAGLLFTANASLFKGNPYQEPQNLEEMVHKETAALQRLENQNQALNAKVAALSETSTAAPAKVAGQPSERLAVTGKGLRVEMWDAPKPLGDLPEGIVNDDLVVHQGDFEAVTNALWLAGAQAMQIQGHRIGPTSGVRCVGNVVLIEGKTYSPPYVIEAIGDPDAMRRALDESRGVQIYLQYVERVSLGWSVTQKNDLSFKAYEGPEVLKYAKPATDDKRLTNKEN